MKLFVDKLRRGLLFLGMLVFAFACTKEDIENSEFLNRFTKINILLTDAPLAIEEVNVDIQKVIVKGVGERDTTCLETNAGIYNLLDYQDGLNVLIAETIVDIEILKEVRLILGDNNSVKVDGELFELKVPSGSQSGLKIKTCVDLTELETFDLVLDFDAAKSVHQQGNGRFMLKPVIKALNGGEGCSGNSTEEEEPEEIDLPENITTFLSNNYPDFEFEAEKTTLCTGLEGYLLEGENENDNTEIELFFTLEGELYYTGEDIKTADLPEAVLQAIDDNYNNGYRTFENSKQLTLEDTTIWYRIKLKRGNSNNNNQQKTVLIDSSGTVICEE